MTISVRVFASHDSDSLTVGLSVMFSIGVVVTMATAYRLSFSIQTIKTWGANFNSPATLDNLMLWSQVEINLGILCANIPGLAALWTTLRARAKARYHHAAAATPPAPSRTHGRSPCSNDLRVKQADCVTRASNEAAGSPAMKIVDPSGGHILAEYHNFIRSTESTSGLSNDLDRQEEV